MVAVAKRGVGTPQTGGEHRPEKVPSGFLGRLFKAIHDFIRRDHYEPAKHYMRGPGPASSQRTNRSEGDDAKV